MGNRPAPLRVGAQWASCHLLLLKQPQDVAAREQGSGWLTVLPAKNVLGGLLLVSRPRGRPAQWDPCWGFWDIVPSSCLPSPDLLPWPLGRTCVPRTWLDLPVTPEGAASNPGCVPRGAGALT